MFVFISIFLWMIRIFNFGQYIKEIIFVWILFGSYRSRSIYWMVLCQLIIHKLLNQLPIYLQMFHRTIFSPFQETNIMVFHSMIYINAYHHSQLPNQNRKFLEPQTEELYFMVLCHDGCSPFCAWILNHHINLSL